MSYQLRRLRLKGLIRRLPKSHRYEVTAAGLRAALFYTGSLSAVIRPPTPPTACNPELQRILLQLRQCLQKTAA